MSLVYGASNAAQIHKTYQDQLRSIRNDENLSDEGRKRLIARAYTTATRQIQELRGKAQAQRGTDTAAVSRKVYSIDDLIVSGMDRGAAAVSYRDAQDRVASITNVDEAAKLLSRAERSGDYVLGRAVAVHALEMGWLSMVDAYAQGHPRWGQAVGAYQNVQPSTQTRLHEDAHMSLPARPVELGFLSDVQAAVLAGM